MYSVTIHNDGSIVKAEAAHKVYYDKNIETFEKVDPREHIVPRLWRYILFTRPAPRGKHFCNIFIENDKF